MSVPRSLANRAVAVLAAAVIVWPVAAWAADDAWPATLAPGWDQRGAGGGLALVPLACWWLCVVGWTATVDWVSRDSRRHKFRPALWGTITALPFVAAAVLAWWIPSAIAALLLMLVAWLGPALAYAVLRNKAVPESDRVLTVDHGRRILARLLEPFGIEIVAPLSEEEALPQVALAAAGGRSPEEDKAREQRAAATAGFEEARKLLQGAVVARAATVTIEPDPQGLAVRHEVDGVWEKPRVRKPPRSRKEKETWLEVPRPDREVAAAVSETLATLAGLAASSRGSRSGTFAISVDGKRRNCRLAIRTGTSGEHLLVQIDPTDAIFKKSADIGMSDPLAARLGELMALEKGLIVLSSPPSSGLTTTFDVVVQSADRLLRDFVSLEDAAAPPREIQNVKPIRFDARTGVSPVDAITEALRDYPSVIVTRDLRDRELAVELARLADDEKLVILSMKASDAIDAVSRLLASGVPQDVLARTLLGSLAQRLVRKLCPKCREEYPTPGEVLARLKMTPEQLPHLRRASPQGCRVCHGTGYLGRVGIFELASGPLLRQAIASRADQRILRQAAIKDGMAQMRDAGMALVVAGVTSLEEMQRVFAAAAAPKPDAVEARKP